MERYRVAHIINNLSRGGAEVLLKSTINLFPEYEHLIIYLHPPAELREELEGKACFICLHHTSWKQLFSTRKRIKNIIRDWQPHIIHAHLFDSTLLARLSKVSRIPIVSTIHSTYSIDAFRKSKKALILERLTVNKQQGLIGVSGFALNDYLEQVSFKGKTYVLHNFLPERNFAAKPECYHKSEELKCVAVGNLKEAKNYFYLLEAFTLLKDYRITLDIYGEGPLRELLTNYINEKELRVRLCGQAGYVLNVLPNYNLFLQASSHEGFGISVAEAMALKLPVLISDIPVFREITDGQAHFFPLNNVNELATILKSLSQDETKRTQFVHNAYEQICKISSEENYKKNLHEIYSFFIQPKS
ncbi:glycosyltransferase [Chitinophagaceae bacterium LB-8]|uniref:Glycosyltransferase n=1 Tax=Paraflavisolibacter caeni TaxID=2982496 RepID=A0A9X3BIG4_9BACT|nr:glycosyltransferase [Paraflavisolibacter caeni]MCU7551302.1 glycosyltransferase [Paraflavisolibacter caeni]